MPFHPPIGVRYTAPITEARPRSFATEAMIEAELRAMLDRQDRELTRELEQLSLEELNARARARRRDAGYNPPPTFPPSPFASPVVQIGLAAAGALVLWLLVR